MQTLETGDKSHIKSSISLAFFCKLLMFLWNLVHFCVEHLHGWCILYWRALISLVFASIDIGINLNLFTCDFSHQWNALLNSWILFYDRVIDLWPFMANRLRHSLLFGIAKVFSVDRWSSLVLDADPLSQVLDLYVPGGVHDQVKKDLLPHITNFFIASSGGEWIIIHYLQWI